MNCIYCADARWEGKNSNEHIWPRKLGGDACPSIFKTRQVCVKCNNFAGLWVDAPFSKNWFMQADAAVSGLKFLGPNKPSPSALLYMGFDDAVPVAEDEVCERWNGLAQEMIFHIHKRDEPRWESVVGGDPIRRKAQAGRVYIIPTCAVDYWIYVVLLSAIQQFPDAERRCLTRLEGIPLTLPIKRVDDPKTNEQEAREIEWLSAHAGEARQIRMSIDIGFTDRFLAKLALGLSHTILGQNCSASKYANHLRSRLWNLDANEPDTNLRGTGFWNDQRDEAFERFLG